jgi:hypothetical protein
MASGLLPTLGASRSQASSNALPRALNWYGA